LLLAASDPTGDASLLWRAARHLGIEQDAAEPVREANLLTIGERVCFRHPLVRSAAYVIASTEERRVTHAALADSTDEVLDPARRVWHLACGASLPDEAIAAELVGAASTAESRAGLAAAAAFLERASSLTPDSARRTDRGLDATEACLQAGELERARTLLAQSAASATTALQLARVEQLTGQIDAAATSGREAPLRLLGAAKRLESLDIVRCRATYLQAWWASVLAGPLAAPGGDIRTVSAAIRATPAPLEPGPADLLLDGLAAAVLEDPRRAVTSLRRGLDSFTTAQLPPREWVRLAGSATTTAFALMDADVWLSLSAREVDLARESGALAALIMALDFQVTATTLCGDFRGAASIAAELDAVKEDTGILEAPVGTQLLAAYRGKRVDAPSVIGGARTDRGAGYSLRLAGWGGAVFNMGFGRYAAALDASRVAADGLLFDSPVVLAEFVEAAVRDGRPEVAREVYQRLSARSRTGTDWALGIEARAHALILDDDGAERFYAQSIDALTRTPLVPDLARSHLVYGEWLRRQNRVLDAREHLKIAYGTFGEIGAEGFAERSRRELAAAGIKATRHGSPGEADLLTEQEHQIALLARSGSSNAEIGTELFLSVRTVEWHLRKVFIKLGVSARGDLKGALADSSQPASSSWIAE
jgi:DNA-binding CsgD family transcriptional regulator